MKQKINRVLSHALSSTIFVSALAVMLIACDGETPSAGQGGIPLTTQQNVNGAQQGWVWHSSAGTRLDMSTGENIDFSNHLIFPRADGREYIELIREYESYFGDSCSGLLSATTSGIHIRDSVTHESLSFIEMRMRIPGRVILSPDGQSLAAWAKPYNVCADDDDTFLQIFSRTGEYIRFSDDALGFDWMPDNLLAFMLYRDGAYKLAVQKAPDTFDGWVLATLPPLPGTPTRFRISPDGSQVLLEVVSGGPVALTAFSFREATVWIMDIDGSNLRQLADTSRPPTITNEVARINQPVWSPDSQHVLMTENYKSGSSIVSGPDINSPTLESLEIFTVNYDYLTYIVPTNSELTLLPPAAISPIGARPLLRTVGQGQIQPIQMTPMAPQYWTPKVE